MTSIRTFNMKTLAYACAGIVLLCSSQGYADVSQSPLSLTIGVPPNMLLTLDDSGSMRFAFAPDSLGATYTTRRAKSSSYNPLYFNPSITYEVPIVFDTSGNEVTLSTSFSKAWHNGFKTSVGSIDLSGANYRVTWDVPITSAPSSYSYTSNTNYSGTGIIYRLAQNPSADFSASATIASNASNKTATVTNSNSTISFAITRTSNSNCTAKATLAGVTITADCSGSNSTFTATLAQSSVPPYYYAYNSALATGCTTANDNCYELKFISSSDQQNFANWYSFYRNRALATVSAAALAFYDLSSSVRLGWQSLNSCTTLTGSDTANCKDNSFQEYSATHKGQLYAWLQNITFDQGTPLPAALKRAGEFYRTSKPWLKNPNGTGNTTDNTYACRASYHIMMTDGMWNATVTEPSDFLHDAATFTLPDGTNYSRIAPYYDSTADTLADLAMHYWATDLNTSLDNDVPAYIPYTNDNSTTEFWDPRNDPATWQHMTNFTMGLGLTTSLSNTSIPWSGSTFTGTGYSNLAAGTVSWPAASGGSNNNVYDLWHAAINSRGEFFSVDTPEAMVQAFEDILSRIADRKSTAARPAVNSGQVTADDGVVTVSYQTSYASDDNWSGDVKRYEKAWNSATGAYETTRIWSASDNVPAWANRNIKIAGETNSGLQAFTWANAGSSTTSGTLAYYLSRDPENSNATDSKGEARLQYLRGNRTGEGSTYRQRSGLLGDFYSSTPAVVQGARYLVNIANKIEGNTSYTSFASTASQRSARVYVGGNDGMLHGFNATTGVEEFAFIPTAVFSKLNKYTASNYTHEFYVEGSPVVADVYDGSEWHTILVGTLKGGGKSIFALDITTPGSEKLLWEFDDDSLPDNATVKMGYSFSQPTIARLHTGGWSVVFGNGYESDGNTNGKAALFIVDAMTGELQKNLEVSGTVGSANGLSTPKLADYNADGVADYAYAGDLQGNMWRFDLLRNGRSSNSPFTTDDDSSTAIEEFEVGFNDNPLFTATYNNTPQPITSAPSLVLHSSGSGYMIIFGTGKFYETGDKEGNKSIAQTIYGIWDQETYGTEAGNPSISHSSLQAQTITDTTTVSAEDGTTRQGRIISNNSIDWTSQNGWYLNLVQDDGEMVVENMSQLGRTIFAQTLVPNDDPCGDGASNWTYALNPYTGGRTSRNSFDYTPTSDIGVTNVSAIRQDGEGGGTITQNPDSTYQYCTGQECVTIYPDASSIGRQTWRRVETEE